MNAMAQSVSAETACEILHKALRPITMSWGLSGPTRSVGALFAAEADIHPKRGDA